MKPTIITTLAILLIGCGDILIEPIINIDKITLSQETKAKEPVPDAMTNTSDPIDEVEENNTNRSDRTLERDTRFDGITFLATTPITFHEDGRVESGYVIIGTIIDGIDYQYGNKIMFYRDGTHNGVGDSRTSAPKPPKTLKRSYELYSRTREPNRYRGKLNPFQVIYDKHYVYSDGTKNSAVYRSVYYINPRGARHVPGYRFSRYIDTPYYTNYENVSLHKKLSLE